MMHDRASGAERIMDRLTPAEQSLARARMAVSRQQAGIAALLEAVDPSLRDHPLFISPWRNGNATAAISKAPSPRSTRSPPARCPTPPSSGTSGALIVRQALAAGKLELAYRAAADYRAGPEGRLVEARFHAGWVAFVYLKEPLLAEPHFAEDGQARRPCRIR